MSAADLSLQPPADGISSLSFSPDSTRLLVGSWDSTIQLHHLVAPPQPPQIFSHPAAVLTVTFGSSHTVAFSGGLDKRVRQWDFETGQCRVLGKHDNAVSSMVWSEEHNVLITGSWDNTLKVWDPSAENALRSTHTLPERIYSLSQAPATSSLLVSMAHRRVHVYSLADLATSVVHDPLEASEGGVDQKPAVVGALPPKSSRESALKFMTRSVACMADGKGWASGSIEGRIAVEFFDSSAEAQAGKYAFRAHRHNVDGVDCVYPINALAYHPIHNTFASGGSDAFISIWDHNAKKRMKNYAQYPTAIAALAFSPDGKKLAIGCSNEHDNAVKPEDAARVLLMIKDTVFEDCKPKAKA